MYSDMDVSCTFVDQVPSRCNDNPKILPAPGNVAGYSQDPILIPCIASPKEALWRTTTSIPTTQIATMSLEVIFRPTPAATWIAEVSPTYMPRFLASSTTPLSGNMPSPRRTPDTAPTRALATSICPPAATFQQTRFRITGKVFPLPLYNTAPLNRRDASMRLGTASTCRETRQCQ